MKKGLLTLGLLSISLVIFAQPRFLPGYLVKKNGDTVHGYLENLPNYLLVQKVNFKTDVQAGDVEPYTINEIDAFGFDGGKFFRAIEYKDPLHQYETRTELAKILVKGYFNLFTIERETQDYYYIKNEQDSGYFLYPDKIDPFTNINNPGNYKGILSFLSRDCSKMNEDLTRLFYSDKDIAKYVNRLNDCIEPGSSQIHLHKSKVLIQGVVSANAWYINSDKNQYSGSAVVRFSKPELNRKFSFNIGLHYFEQKDLYYRDDLYKGHTRYNELNQMTSLPVFLQFYFSEGRVRPYFNIGLSWLHWKKSVDEYYSSQAGVDYHNSGSYSVNQISFITAAGVDAFLYKGLGLKAEIRYEEYFHYPTLGIFYLFNK